MPRRLRTKGALVLPSISYSIVPSALPQILPAQVKRSASKVPRAVRRISKESPRSSMSSRSMIQGRAVQLRSWKTT